MTQDKRSKILELFKENELRSPSSLRPDDTPYPSVVEASLSPTSINAPYFVDIDLLVAWSPNQAPRVFRVRSNIAGDGAVGVVVCGEKLLLLRQWRVPLGRYTWEVPRGLSDSFLDNPTQGDNLPAGLRTALRETREEAAIMIDPNKSHFLGEVAENSGTHTGSPSYWLIELPEKCRTIDTSTHRWVSLEEALTLVEDNHSATACALFVRHLIATTGQITLSRPKYDLDTTRRRDA